MSKKKNSTAIDLPRVRNARALLAETKAEHPDRFKGGSTDAEIEADAAAALGAGASERMPLRSVRLPQELLDAIDRYRLSYGQKHRIRVTQSDAIRRLLELGLEAEGVPLGEAAP